MDHGDVKFGILGCASIARKMSRAIIMTPGASLHAVGSRSLEKAKSFATTNNLPAETKLYGSYKEVLDDDAVDVVYLPLPTSLHVEWLSKAVEKKKHVLIEKPAALTTSDMDDMLLLCEKNGLQFMDCTMFIHHPRTAQMEEVLKNYKVLGNITQIQSTFFVPVHEFSPSFFEENIRTKPDLDALGALGDLGWYCARAILWATGYELPQSVMAFPEPKFNDSGVMLSCSASCFWKDGRTATFHCSFLANMCMDLTVHGQCGTLEVDDFVIPHKEDECDYKVKGLGTFGTLDVSWSCPIETRKVQTKAPQESLLIANFSQIVNGIKAGSGTVDPFWPMISRKTQYLINAVKDSVEKGYTRVSLPQL